MNTCTIQLTEQTALVLKGCRCVLSKQHTRTLLAFLQPLVSQSCSKEIPIQHKERFCHETIKLQTVRRSFSIRYNSSHHGDWTVHLKNHKRVLLRNTLFNVPSASSRLV